jgi:hypothetical protein|tara:strand:+ start:157 stop:774 length:618 start_codon:yes stop_codon:yes gene_type:complete
MKNNNVKIVSPVGVSQYAWLTQPDTRFDNDGHYKTNLIIKAEDAKSLIKTIDDEMKESFTLAKEKAKGKKVKEGNTPYEMETDDDGQETGNVIFKFKTKAQIISKDGKVIPNRVAIFDSKGKPMTDVNVWSGSEMKCSAELIKYYTAIAGAGVSLRLRAVQITKLVEGGAGNAKGYGFDDVKDGYEFEEKADVVQEEAEKQETDF